jgi:hypothetical protein
MTFSPKFTITNHMPPAIINNTSSVSYLRKHALGAKLDDGLYRAMQTGEGRGAYAGKDVMSVSK